MPRVDDYRHAVELGRKALLEKEPAIIADVAGAVLHKDSQGNKTLSLQYLNRDITFTWPDLRFKYSDSQEEIPIQQQILFLHYLYGTSSGAKISGEWISFQEVPDGRFYMSAFLKRAKDPLLDHFGKNPKIFVELTRNAYGAVPFDHGDHSVIVKALPLVPIAIVIWEGDEEFPPDGNILFDRSISNILSAEDIAWLAGMVIYPLIGMISKG